MDNLTHSLVGALIGQAGLKKKTGLAMPALIIGANLPDVDAACFFWLDGVEHLAFRRGITHGPPALVLLPLILAGLLWAFDRWQAGRGQKRFGRPEGRLPVRFGWLYALSFIGCLTHPALDWLNVYGIRLLEPFSSRWFYGDTLFIIDVWLWGLMGFATWWSLRQEKRGGAWRRTGRQALALVLVYIGVNGAITQSHQRMTPLNAVGPVIASPLPFAFWEREIIIPLENGRYKLIPRYSGPTDENVSSQTLGDPTLSYYCDLDTLAALNSQTRSFLFWSRAPFVERDEEGNPWLRDARFYDPRARDRFSVRVPDVACEPLKTEPVSGAGG